MTVDTYAECSYIPHIRVCIKTAGFHFCDFDAAAALELIISTLLFCYCRSRYNFFSVLSHFCFNSFISFLFAIAFVTIDC